MVAGWSVDGVASGVPDRWPAGRWAGVVSPVEGGEGGRDPGAVPPARGASAAGATAAVDVGGPGGDRRPGAAAAAGAAGGELALRRRGTGWGGQAPMSAALARAFSMRARVSR